MKRFWLPSGLGDNPFKKMALRMTFFDRCILFLMGGAFFAGVHVAVSEASFAPAILSAFLLAFFLFGGFERICNGRENIDGIYSFWPNDVIKVETKNPVLVLLNRAYGIWVGRENGRFCLLWRSGAIVKMEKKPNTEYEVDREELSGLRSISVQDDYTLTEGDLLWRLVGMLKEGAELCDEDKSFTISIPKFESAQELNMKLMLATPDK